MDGVDALFVKYEPLIHDRANYFAKKYSLERDDIAAEGFATFMDIINRYDEKKSKFSTFLWLNLQYHLENYCRMQRGWKNNIFNTEEDFDSWLIDDRPRVQELKDIKIDSEQLSEQAKVLFDYIIYREWETPGKKPRKPSYSFIERRFRNAGWRKTDVKAAWNELKIWWCNKGDMNG